MSELVQVLSHGAVRELRLARPPVNALDDALMQALARALEDSFADAQVAGVVLSGNERVFSGGLDVPHLISHGQDRDALRATWSAFLGLAGVIAAAPIPVAAALTGHAPAGGCVLALCSDYRVMCHSVDAAHPLQIGLNETQVGLAVPDGIQHLMRRAIGAHQTSLWSRPGRWSARSTRCASAWSTPSPTMPRPRSNTRCSGCSRWRGCRRRRCAGPARSPAPT